MLAEQALDARVVKAFNTIPLEVFELAPEPLKDYNVSVFVAADDPAAKQAVMQLAQEIGFNPIDSGGDSEATRQTGSGKWRGDLVGKSGVFAV